jgi:uncharacterized protein (TIGR00369 family)
MPGGKSNLPEFPDCFVCGSQNSRGLRVPFKIERDSAVGFFTPDKSCAGYDDAVHGGIISSLLDEALIWACYHVTGRFGVTAELSVRFKKPVKIGMKCVIKGILVSDEGRLWKAESELTDEHGKVYASAFGKIFPVKK